MALVPAGGVPFLRRQERNQRIGLERRLRIAPAMQAALSKTYPGAHLSLVQVYISLLSNYSDLKIGYLPI